MKNPGKSIQEDFVAKVHVADKAYDVDLVIFDKDGTLIDFKETWVQIIGSLINAMGTYIPMTDVLRKRVQEVLGVSVDSPGIDGNGPLAMGTFVECNALLTYCLYREGLRWDEAQVIVRKLGDEIFRSDVREKSIKPAQGVLTLLKRLKEKGVHIAVATNDNAQDALTDMLSIGAAQWIDIVVGADSVENSKPAPDMVRKICEYFHVGPDSALLIGDTVMDALLGKNSGVMLTIGVPGIVTRQMLEKHMDVVVDSLDEIT
ncbi:MAG: HAD family hydrolase [Desulfobacterota bacterium]|jgi:phosphoglycolate phosphatase|nr:HAD family hydrolase [Thermodesulfobacteriota bacterium]